jgi:polyisoprenoid-binding protein YceI
MKKSSMNLLTVLAFTSLLFSFKTAAKSEWALDKPHAKLGFTVGHLMVSDVEGWFKDFDAKITSEKEDFSDALVTLTAQTSSINTDNEKRDADLKSSSYFDVAKYPLMTFKSKTFKKTDDKNYKVTGDLTIHGITKTVELNALCRMGTNPMSKKTIAGFKVTGTIKRLDFGIGASTPTAMIGDEVTLVANVEFDKE